MDAGFGAGVDLSTLLANTAPVAEATAATAGAANAASRQDHVHPRLTSVGAYTLDANGECVIVFTRTFPTQPGVVCTVVEAADNQPVFFKVKSWTQVSTVYTGCTIKAYRSQILPTLSTALSGIILIGPLISALTSSLSNFNTFGGSAAGLSFSCVAIMASTP